MIRAWVATATLVIAMGVVHANPVRLVTSGDGCDVSGLSTRITKLVDSDPFVDSASAAVLIEISQEQHGFVASVSFTDGDGHPRGPRIVRAGACEELLESVAIIVAMALPTLNVDPTPVSVPAPSVPKLSSEPAATPIAHAEARPSLVAHAEEFAAFAPEHATDADLFFAGAGALSGDGFRGHVVIGARWRRASRSFGVELRGDTPESLSVGGMGRIDVFRAQLTGTPCLHFHKLGACALVSIGTIYGSGAGLINGRAAFTPLVAGGVRLAWSQLLTHRFALQLHLDLAGLLTRTEFAVDEMPVWSSPRFEGAVGAGFRARFL